MTVFVESPCALHTWHTGPVKRAGDARYAHLIRQVGDPPAERGPYPVVERSWRIDEAEAAMVELLETGEARTFNGMCFELTGLDADQHANGVFDKALWNLVDERVIDITIETPVFFRLHKG